MALYERPLSFKFDFGPGPCAEGYVKVDPGTRYAPELGYGFETNARVYGKYRTDDLEGHTGAANSLKQSFCIPLGASFVVDVPDGTYRVKLLSGDALAETVTNVKAGEGRQMLPPVHAAAGQWLEAMFSVVVRGDGRLRLTFTGPAPRINALEIWPENGTLTVFLAGDSTVTDQPESGYPYCGWGQMLPAFFKHDVAVDNHARSGHSSLSFVKEGLLDPIMERIKPGDFLFLQFGHNDEKPDAARRTEPFSTFQDQLKLYLEAARSKQATPVLVTPVHRRYFKEDGTLQDTHGDYITAIRELAAQEAVPLIDLAERSRRLFEQAGVEGTKDDFMWVLPGEFIHFPAGVEDNTHFQERGARRLAAQVVEAILELQLQPLQMFLR